METRATIKGQIVIPAALRHKFNIQGGPGPRFLKRRDGSCSPVTRETIHSARGLFKGSGALKILREKREKERDVEVRGQPRVFDSWAYWPFWRMNRPCEKWKT